MVPTGERTGDHFDTGEQPMGSTRRSTGDGSVYQRHDRGCPPVVDGVRPEHDCKGAWVGVYVIAYRDGKPIRKKRTATTRAGAAAKVRELREQHTAGELPEGKAITVQQWMDHWVTKILPRTGAEPSTLATYGRIVAQYINPLLGSWRLDRLTPEHIDEAWEVLLEEGNPALPESRRRPLGANTVHLSHAILSRALKVAVQRRRLKVNPAGTNSMDAPPRVEEEVKPIPASDVRKIISAAEGTPYGARWSVALALGLRPGETLGLRWSDVDFDEGVLHVRQQLQRVKGKGLVEKTPKSSAGVRSMYLPPTLLAGLKSHRKAQNEARLRAGDHWTDSGLVFTLDNGRGISAEVDRRRWRALLESAGVEHRRLYDARHSAGTLLLAQGVAPRTAMALLGHSQVSVTMRYQHAVDEIKAAAASQIEAGMWGN